MSPVTHPSSTVEYLIVWAVEPVERPGAGSAPAVPRKAMLGRW